MTDLIKTDSLVKHFKAILDESQKHISFNEIMFGAKTGHERQCAYLIDRFENCISEMRRDDLITWMKELLNKSKQNIVNTNAEFIYKQNSEAVIETFIKDLESGKEF